MCRTVATSVNQCNGCTYCCWAYAIKEMPVVVQVRQLGVETYHKMSMEDCPYCDGIGCNIYNSYRRPKDCITFFCPQILLDRGNPTKIKNKYTEKIISFRIHPPYLFKTTILEVLDKNTKGLVFPAVPIEVDPSKAIELIQETGCVPVIHDGLWQLQMLNNKDPQAAMSAWRNGG